MNEGVVLDLLHPLDLAIHFERLLELLLRALLGEVPSIQNFDLERKVRL